MIHIDFTQYSTQELRELNRNLVEYLRLQRQRDSQKSMDRFNLHDIVFFTDSHGNVVEGKIIRFNQKTVTIERSCGHQWRVSPQLLQKVVQSKSSKKTTMRISAEAVPIVNKFLQGIPRNAPCPCGSGKKYKRCCLMRNAH